MHRFTPAKPSKPRKLSFIAIDTETDPATGRFICGAAYGERINSRGNAVLVSEYYDTQEEFIAGIKTLESIKSGGGRRFVLIGFNVDYDIIYLRQHILSKSKVYAGSRFICAKTVNGTKIMDCGNHVIGSLQSWIERLKMEERYGICKREGYLDSDEGKRAQVLDDARATYILACWIRDYYIDNFGVSMKNTKFGNALAIFQTRYFKGAWYRTDREEWKNDFERESYFGGRTEVFQRGEIEVNSYDVNGMYVAIMANERVPNPTISKLLREPHEIHQRFENGDIMTMDVTVTTPKRKIGLLPVKSKTGKLLFPYGTWRGVYNSIELRAAVRHGATINEYHKALYYPETDYYFREYAEMTQEGRKAAKAAGDDAQNQFYKYLGNGLYGKFGQRNSAGGDYIRLEEYTGDVNGMTVIWRDDNEGWVYIPKSAQTDALHTFPIIPATITAYARAKLLDALCVNEEIAVYCDTDSIKVSGDVTGIPISDNPGDWGYEYTAKQSFYRPKCYADKRKGVPKRAKKVTRIFDVNHNRVEREENIEEYLFQAPIKYKSSLRRGKYQNVWVEVCKKLMMEDDKRVWSGRDSMPIYLCADTDTV